MVEVVHGDRDVLFGNGIEALTVLEDQCLAIDVRNTEKFWLGQYIRDMLTKIFNRRKLGTSVQEVEKYPRNLEQLSEIKQSPSSRLAPHMTERNQDHV